eukprot:CAMPEP_0113311810 /NCGR_PEP_ID=MMETSP0010_2-20120614/8888_1 /TAXON_ID=216773 ORGANISM="Corethron hystrix, Strain 308" /NCGR_SAMPLE_ID=MMETSP0010_2 /ASSEMBLY_ACC=CAM_ASM_000155 /LENGTH=360 /DNA_ID=CAMNT_0000167503 /DNA_START=326 /DNA_END=1405 /DNA_ORIENTATION=- /assembly_acc=CAM_ASM_000155
MAKILLSIVPFLTGSLAIQPSMHLFSPLSRIRPSKLALHLSLSKLPPVSPVKTKRNGPKTSIDADEGLIDPVNGAENNVDKLRARAGILRTSIVRQQRELQVLERQIACCSGPSPNDQNPLLAAIIRSGQVFQQSSKVLSSRLESVRSRIGRPNEWKSLEDYAVGEVSAGARIVQGLLKDPARIMYLADRDAPALVPHAPAILSRLDKLEPHVEPILERVLNNRRHLASIEPYLDEVLNRFDDIEPHLDWILDNVDSLAPYTGLLLKHIDELLVYANDDELAGGGTGKGHALAEQLLPYLEYYVSKLDVIGPHLPLLRPHVPLLLKKNRIGKISPHIDRLFSKGYKDLSASANIDVLLFW